jgi:hypothetical protein
LNDDYDFTGAVGIVHYFTPNLGMSLEFERDPLLLNRLTNRISWDMGFIGIEAGPFIGMMNTGTGSLSPGLSLVLRIAVLQGNLFGSFRVDTALGRSLENPGDHAQSATAVSLGGRFFFGTVLAGMSDRSFQLQEAAEVVSSAHWIRYNLALELPSPAGRGWGFRFEAGYQQLEWIYKIPSFPLNYRYRGIYTGLETSFHLQPLTLLLGVEFPLYPLPFPDFNAHAFLAQATLSLRWTMR